MLPSAALNRPAALLNNTNLSTAAKTPIQRAQRNSTIQRFISTVPQAPIQRAQRNSTIQQVLAIPQSKVSL